MPIAILLTALTLGFSKPEITFSDLPPAGGNSFYVGNRAPLEPSPLRKLPIGSVTASGWLQKQLRLQADGWAGHLTEISRFLVKNNNAWLSPTGVGRNGWEEVPYWLRGYVALAIQLKDKKMLQEAKVWIDATIKSQREDGYFGPRSNLTASNGHPDIWPNELMMCTLRNYYEATKDPRILPLMTKYYHWQLSVPDEDLLTGYWEHVRVGDDIGPIVWLYNRTGDPKLVQLIQKVHKIGAPWDARVANWHGVNFAQGFREPAQYYEVSKNRKDLKATERDFDAMRDNYGQVPGGMYCADENARPGFTDPRQAAETCAMVEVMYSCEELLAISGEARWGDRCEDVAFNSLPAAMTPDLKALHYLTSPNMVLIDSKPKTPDLENGGPMLWFNPYEHRCCQHNTAFGWPYYAEHTWMATDQNGLAAVLYGPCAVTARVGSGTSATITEDTHYPFDETIRMKLKLSRSDRFPLTFRIPEWCDDPKITVDGYAFPSSLILGHYAILDRTWANGDSVALRFPMRLSIKMWSENKDGVSVERGPLTYSLKIGEKMIRDGGTDAWPAWDVKPTTDWNYGLLPDISKMKVIEKAFPASNQPFTTDASPIVITAEARRIPEWGKDYLGVVCPLQNSPAQTQEPIETVQLVPMGAARLRISMFPTVSKDGAGTPWVAPDKIDLIPATASRVGFFDSTDALSDTYYPGHAPKGGAPARFVWGSRGGTTEWVAYHYPTPHEFSHCEVYWVDGRGTGAPASWKLQYKDGDVWKDVEAKCPYPVVKTGFSAVDFTPITGSEFRLMATLQEGRDGGIWEWRLK